MAIKDIGVWSIIGVVAGPCKSLPAQGTTAHVLDPKFTNYVFTGFAVRTQFKPGVTTKGIADLVSFGSRKHPIPIWVCRILWRKHVVQEAKRGFFWLT